MELNEKTKQNLQELIGIPYNYLSNMDIDSVESYIEQKNNKKITFSKEIKIDGFKIKTMEEVNRQIDKICKVKTYKK